MKASDIYRTDKQTGKTHTTSFSRMEAIACGVQARLEANTGYSKKVTDETVSVARALGVANSEIERWATYRLSRLARDAEILREIRALLNKVYGNKPNHIIRGM